MSSVRVFYPEMKHDELVGLLGERLQMLDKKLPLERAVLFGSWATDRATTASDIDLLLIHRGAAADNAYSVAWKTLQMPRLELHLYSESEAENMGGTISKMTQGGLDLFRGNDKEVRQHQ